MIRIFLDACIIIYWIELAPPFYNALLSKLKIIAEKHPYHTLTISRLSFLECLVQPLRQKNHDLLCLYQKFFEAPSISIVEVDAAVIDIAINLRAQYSLRTPDAIQVASCLSGGDPHLFLTNDKRLSCIKELHSMQLLCK